MLLHKCCCYLLVLLLLLLLLLLECLGLGLKQHELVSGADDDRAVGEDRG